MPWRLARARPCPHSYSRPLPPIFSLTPTSFSTPVLTPTPTRVPALRLEGTGGDVIFEASDHRPCSLLAPRVTIVGATAKEVTSAWGSRLPQHAPGREGLEETLFSVGKQRYQFFSLQQRRQHKEKKKFRYSLLLQFLSSTVIHCVLFSGF